MRKYLYLVIFLSIYGVLNIGFAETKTFDDPKGYKDFIWGDSLESIQKTLQIDDAYPSKREFEEWEISKNKDIKLYSDNSNNNNRFLGRTKYLFYKDKLVKVIVGFRNSVEDYSHEEIKKSLIKKMIEKHGEKYNKSEFSRWFKGDFEPYKINYEQLTWDFETTTVKLTFSYYDKPREMSDTTALYEMKGLKIEKESIDKELDF